jgi:sec-independent protein translocase protein TatC
VTFQFACPANRLGIFASGLGIFPIRGVRLMAKNKSTNKNSYDEYPDDIFKDTRMSFGDHIEELRYRMLTGLKWLVVFLIAGFILDGIGQAIGNPRIGIGKPMTVEITEPVKQQVNDFYNRRIEKARNEKLAEFTKSTPEVVQRIKNKLAENNNNISVLTSEERRLLLGAPEEMPVELPTEAFEGLFGPANADAPRTIAFNLQVYPAFVNYMSEKGEGLLETKQHLSSLSVQEPFVVYFKVQILCGIVLASPFLFYQFWAFVGAGLYPHEKKYVYMMFAPSLLLFIGGVILCQFVVLPGAVKALLLFNEWLGFDPDIRLNEWLGLAIILPLVFGISFQTPLVMIFLNRIGIFTAEDYLSKWRHACMVLAVFAAVITPTPDVITMMYLFGPMFGLYLVGIAICHYFPGVIEEDEEAEEAEEVAV